MNGYLGKVRQHIRSNVIGYVALFFALGGTAYASVIVTSNSQVATDTISGHKPPTGDHSNLIAGSVNAKDLAAGAVTTGRLAANSVTGAKVADGSLTGADVNANSITGSNIDSSTLGEVPSAKIGGLGRSTDGATCNPSGGFIDCAVTTINLPTPARVLLIGHAIGIVDFAQDDGSGHCKLVTDAGDVGGTDVEYFPSSSPWVSDVGETSGITGVLDAGSHDFGIDCNQVNDFGGGIEFTNTGITAVAISPD